MLHGPRFPPFRSDKETEFMTSKLEFGSINFQMGCFAVSGWLLFHRECAFVESWLLDAHLLIVGWLVVLYTIFYHR